MRTLVSLLVLGVVAAGCVTPVDGNSSPSHDATTGTSKADGNRPDTFVDAPLGLDEQGGSTDAHDPATDAHDDREDGRRVDLPASGADADATCVPGTGAATIDVTALKVTNAAGAPPTKGDELVVTVSLVNSGNGAGRATITPLFTSKRFFDWMSIPLGAAEITVCPGNTEVTIKAGPFFADKVKAKHYALGRGDYVVSGVTVAVAGQAAKTDTSFAGAAFTVGASNAILVPVLYDERYFTGIDGGEAATGTPEHYLVETYTRPNEVFQPSGSDPDGPGAYKNYPGGFEEMMKTRHRFQSFPGFPSGATDGLGWCERVGAYAKTALGLTADWTGAGTLPEHHGFDYVIGLTPDMGGGVACGWLDIQVSSFINRDIDRQKVILIHETGHIFGAPHCDDVGNGSGQALQGYVMCSGEKHMHYPGTFVWHSTSFVQMKSHWD